MSTDGDTGDSWRRQGKRKARSQQLLLRLEHRMNQSHPVSLVCNNGLSSPTRVVSGLLQSGWEPEEGWVAPLGICSQSLEPGEVAITPHAQLPSVLLRGGMGLAV